MKKKIFIALTIVILICALIGGYNYYRYNYVELVTDYYGITYTPPVKRNINFFGSVEYSEPKVDVENLPQYYNDSSAVSDKRKEFYKRKKNFLSEYVKEEKVAPRSQDEKLEHAPKLQALREMLQEQYIVVSFTHHRNYDAKDFLRFLRKNGINWTKMKEFCDKNDLSSKYYVIY
jgi:hypothetical protein